MNILVISFNRPVLLKRQIEHLLSLGLEMNIFIHNDGARLGNKQDKIDIEKIKLIIDSFIHELSSVRVSNVNYGCRLGVLRAIDWFFSQVVEGIIVEDDVIIRKEALHWMSTSLTSYRQNMECFMISAQSILQENTSGFFIARSKVPLIWGWATWKDRWDLVKSDYSDWTSMNKMLEMGYSLKYALQILSNYTGIKKGKLDTWDTDILLWLVTNNAYCLAPSVNLSENIGIGIADATHTSEGLPAAYLFNKREYDNFMHKLENLPLEDVSANSTMKQIYKIHKKSTFRIFLNLIRNKIW